MRVALVSAHADPRAPLGGIDSGGQNAHVDALAAALSGRGHSVTVYTRCADPTAPSEVDTAGGYRVSYVPAGPPGPLAKEALVPHLGDFADGLASRWALERPDVVHAHYWTSAFAARLATRSRPVATVVTFHTLAEAARRNRGDRSPDTVARGKVEKLLARTASRVVATASEDVGDLVRLGVPRRSISVIPAGVDLDTFHPAPIATGARPPRRHRLAAAGRLVPRKGFDLTIAALAAIPDAELSIAAGANTDVASDPEARRLTDLARTHGVADRVRIGPIPRDRMPDFWRAADLAVFTPGYEPFGISAIEAMACGTPVVASAVGGLLDTVIDGITGVLVPRRSPGAVAEAVRRLLDDDGRRTGFGMSAADRARARYSLEHIALDTERVYTDALPEPAADDGPEDIEGTDRAEAPTGRLDPVR